MMNPEQEEFLMRAKRVVESARYRSAILLEQLDDSIAQEKLALELLDDVKSHIAKDLMRDAG